MMSHFADTRVLFGHNDLSKSKKNMRRGNSRPHFLIEFSGALRCDDFSRNSRDVWNVSHGTLTSRQPSA